MEAWYYQSMDKLRQAVYKGLLEGILALEGEIPIPRIEPREIPDLLFLLRLDHPEIFWVTGFRYRAYPDSPNLVILPDYLMEKGKIREHQKAMKARVEKLVRPLRDKPPEEQELFIHDFICKNVTYDKLKKPYSHEIIGPLGQGVGVCEGIAKSVKVLADALGLWCVIALSDNAPEKGIRYRHTWNVIRLNKKNYHLDATFDLSLGKGGAVRYDYYNLDDGRVFRDHEPLLFPVPACTDGNSFYYRQKKLSFTKEEEVANRAAQAAKKGRELTFQWRGGGLSREALESILRTLGEAGRLKGLEAHVSLNFPQAVFRVSYLPAGSGGVTLEKPDEEERETVGENTEN